MSWRFIPKVTNSHEEKRMRFWSKSLEHQKLPNINCDSPWTTIPHLMYALDRDDRPGASPLNIYSGPQTDQLVASRKDSPRHTCQQNAKLMIPYNTHSIFAQTMHKTVGTSLGKVVLQHDRMRLWWSRESGFYSTWAKYGQSAQVSSKTYPPGGWARKPPSDAEVGQAMPRASLTRLRHRPRNLKRKWSPEAPLKNLQVQNFAS